MLTDAGAHAKADDENGDRPRTTNDDDLPDHEATRHGSILGNAVSSLVDSTIPRTRVVSSVKFPLHDAMAVSGSLLNATATCHTRLRAPHSSPGDQCCGLDSEENREYKVFKLHNIIRGGESHGLNSV